MRSELVCAVLVAAAGLLAGCVSFDAVETTPEGIVGAIEPGDTVRLTTRDGADPILREPTLDELTLQVRSVTDSEIRGRREGGSPELVSVRFDRIESLEVERANLKKAMLTTLVPAVLAAIIVCNHQDCETRSVLTATQ